MKIDGSYSVCVVKMAFGLPMKRYGTMKLWVDPDNGSLKGTMFPRFFWLDAPFRGGKVEGNRFSFTAYFSSPCQQFSMDVQGMFDGERIWGTLRDPEGEAEFEGVRCAEQPRGVV